MKSGFNIIGIRVIDFEFIELDEELFLSVDYIIDNITCIILYTGNR